jgi:histidine ammonia-lyase
MLQATIGTSFLTINDLNDLLSTTIQLDKVAEENITHCRAYLDSKIEEADAVYYGINTGFGSLCNIKINDKDIAQLQENLVLSHACGMGDEVPIEVVKIMLLLKIKNFTYGHSGISLQVVHRLLAFYNQSIFPVIYQLGSLGASGDLAPLAHLSLPLLGKGNVYVDGKKIKSSALSFDPLVLQSKEGLALLNGTQFMSSYAVWCLQKIEKLLDWANAIAAMSFDGFDGVLSPFNEHIHTVRPYAGQRWAAEQMRTILKGSEIATKPKTQVQDPYSFRCIPQVHGATHDAFIHVKQIVETEINSVTDNPLIFPKEDLIVSGGNFHGQPLAINLDYMAIAIAELANISERRTYLLISGQRELPHFLTADAGLQSGMMIAQYTAASIVSKNKQLCTPASVDSIVSSNGQEDHVSMGANAATKLKEVVDNVERVLAIELLCAAQTIEFRKPLKTSPILENLLKAYRQKVSFNTQDRILSDDMMASVEFMNEFKF